MHNFLQCGGKRSATPLWIPSAHSLVGRLPEAHGSGYWDVDANPLNKLRKISGSLGDQLEGVAKGGCLNNRIRFVFLRVISWIVVALLGKLPRSTKSHEPARRRTPSPLRSAAALQIRR